MEILKFIQDNYLISGIITTFFTVIFLLIDNYLTKKPKLVFVEVEKELIKEVSVRDYCDKIKIERLEKEKRDLEIGVRNNTIEQLRKEVRSKTSQNEEIASLNKKIELLEFHSKIKDQTIEILNEHSKELKKYKSNIKEFMKDKF